MASCQTLPEQLQSAGVGPWSSSPGCVGQCCDGIRLMTSGIFRRASCPLDPLLKEVRGAFEGLTWRCRFPCSLSRRPLFQGWLWLPGAHVPAKGTCAIKAPVSVNVCACLLHSLELVDVKSVHAARKGCNNKHQQKSLIAKAQAGIERTAIIHVHTVVMLPFSHAQQQARAQCCALGQTW